MLSKNATHLQQVLAYLKQGHPVVPAQPMQMPIPALQGNMPQVPPPDLSALNYRDKYDIMDSHQPASWRWPVTGGQ